MTSCAGKESTYAYIWDDTTCIPIMPKGGEGDINTVAEDIRTDFNVTGVSLVYQGGATECPGEEEPKKYYQL